MGSPTMFGATKKHSLILIGSAVRVGLDSSVEIYWIANMN